ncbi:cupin domain-containing protein [Rhodococcus koreensis]|uniref:cupin domain-containing protein n=1 Tax=Rhodococcus koreensis TaxID=99653 RepID=UPI00366AB861
MTNATAAELEPIEVSHEIMSRRVARFADLSYNPDRYSDSRREGAQRKVFNVVGAGLEMTAGGESLPAIEVAEGFNITYVLAKPGNGPSLHIHDANETFIAVNGHWRVIYGTAEDGVLELGPFDCVSVPALVPRRFVNITEGSPDEENLLVAILAGDTPRAKFVDATLEK